MHKFKVQIILPFRALIEPLTVSGKMPGEEIETTFKLFYDDTIQTGTNDGTRQQVLGPDQKRENLKSMQLEGKCFTLVEIYTQFVAPTGCELPESRDDWVKWMFDNHPEVMRDQVLPKLNHFLNHLKLSNPSLLETVVLRNVDECDFIFYNLVLDDVVVWARGTSTLLAVMGAKSCNVSCDISKPLPKESTILSRASDLVNHGYYLEAFVVGFALLDDIVQEFLKEKLPNLNSVESKEILCAVERNKLKIFLGPIMKMVTGTIPLEDTPNGLKDIKWINEKRNKIMHRGEDCACADAQRGLKIVLRILRFLNEKGGNYSLPDKLHFWTDYIK